MLWGLIPAPTHSTTLLAVWDKPQVLSEPHGNVIPILLVNKIHLKMSARGPALRRELPSPTPITPPPSSQVSAKRREYHP